jgi:hypothetical protein
LHEFSNCPSRWLKGYRRAESDATDFGSLVDCLALTPAQFSKRYVVRPKTYEAVDKKTKESVTKPWNGNATVCGEWMDAHSHLEVVKPDDFNDADNAVASLTLDLAIREILSSINQVWCEADYTDRATGITIRFKVLIDLLPSEKGGYRQWIIDLKTSRNASLRAWARDCYALWYHVQAAVYMDVYASAVPEDDRNTWGQIIVENVAPFQTAKRWLTADMVNLGRQTYQAALARYCRCLSDGVWPDYDSHSRSMIPGWGEVAPEAWMASAETIYEPLEEPEQKQERGDDQGIVP